MKSLPKFFRIAISLALFCLTSWISSDAIAKDSEPALSLHSTRWNAFRLSQRLRQARTKGARAQTYSNCLSRALTRVHAHERQAHRHFRLARQARHQGNRNRARYHEGMIRQQSARVNKLIRRTNRCEGKTQVPILRIWRAAGRRR